MSYLLTLLSTDQLLESMTPIAFAGLIVYILIQRRLTAVRERAHQEEVYSMNRERSAWRIRKQQHQAAIANLKERIHQQQDVIDELTGVSVPKFFHLN